MKILGIRFKLENKIIPGRILFTIVGVIAAFFVSSKCYSKDIQNDITVRNLKILTSFSPDFYKPFVDAYRKKNPELSVQILNKKTTAALIEIERGNIREFDIFWSSSPDAFAVLKNSGKLKQLGYLPNFPPLSDKKYLSGDTEGYFYNFAISGMGYMWNAKTLKQKGVSQPSSWYDLAHPRFYGHLAMSTPSRSGTNHLIVESLLQGMGWEDGWRFLLQVSGNFETITARSFSVPDGVASGRFGAGLVIDFLAISKMHSQKEIGFSYGTPVFVMPAGVAVLKNGKNVDEAVAFIDYLLSDEGQQILLEPSIGRLPVSGALFSSDKQQFHPLMSLIQDGSTLPYDTELSRRRYLVVNSLFDQLITYRLLDRRHIWKRLIQLEKTYGVDSVEKRGLRNSVLDLLCQVPVSEEQSLDPLLNGLFSASASAEKREKRRELLKEWDEFVSIRVEQAERAIAEADQLLSQSQDNL